MSLLDIASVLAATVAPLFGSLPNGSVLVWTLSVRLVPTVCVAGLVGWDAGRRSDNPRAWPTAAVLVGVTSTAALVVLTALYVVAGRDGPDPDPDADAVRRDGGPRR